MRVMLLIHTDESAAGEPVPAAPTVISPEYAAYTEALEKAGANLGGERLQPVSRGARVRVRDGKTQVLDGPYSDSKEQLAGYYLIEAADLDEAIAWAARCPAAASGTVEVRPVWELTRA